MYCVWTWTSPIPLPRPTLDPPSHNTLGDLTDALAAYMTALQLCPTQSALYSNIALVQLRWGHVNEVRYLALFWLRGGLGLPSDRITLQAQRLVNCRSLRSLPSPLPPVILFRPPPPQAHNAAISGLYHDATNMKAWVRLGDAYK